MPIVRHLLADQFGSHVGKYAERLKVTLKGKAQAQAPLIHLETVTISGRGVSISADAIEACCERGIPIYMLNDFGRVYASLFSAGIGATITTRREQLLAYYDERGRTLAVIFSIAKMQNQARTLRYWARNRRDKYPEQGETLTHAANAILQDIERLNDAEHADDRDQLSMWLMGMEGTAARRYWQAVGLLIPEAYGWQGRVGRGARDRVNSLLNYGYGILYGEVERAIVLAGLDPYAGFLHADRPGKPSLVLDLIEAFRQIVVDRTVIGLIARNYAIELDDEGRLTPEVRRDFASKIIHQLEGKTRYQGKRFLVRHIIQMQARELASFLRGDHPYNPFVLEE